MAAGRRQPWRKKREIAAKIQEALRRLERGEDPTPDEIAEKCLEIQSGWDAKTREARRISKAEPMWVTRVHDNVGYIHRVGEDLAVDDD